MTKLFKVIHRHLILHCDRWFCVQLPPPLNQNRGERRQLSRRSLIVFLFPRLFLRGWGGCTQAPKSSLTILNEIFL